MEISPLLPDGLSQITILDENEAEMYFVYTPKLIKAQLLIQYLIVSLKDKDIPGTTFISVSTYDEKESQKFYVVQSSEPMAALQLSRLIIDLVAYIERELAYHVPIFDILSRISTMYVSSNEQKTKKKKQEQYEFDRRSIEYIFDMIKHKGNSLN
jgi:hypothetical protein